MKSRIFLGLCIVLGAGCLAVRAADTPAQAAARVALEQKLSRSDAWEPQPLTAVITPAMGVVGQPVKSTATATGTVSGKAVISQSTLASTAPKAAPAAVVSIAVAPRILFLVLSLLIISFLTMSFLFLKLLRQNSRQYDSRQASTGSHT